MTTSVEVPAAVRQRALAHGAVGVEWLRDLPRTLDALEQQWKVTIGPMLGGGTAAYVAEATTASGAAAVVKVAMPAAIDGAAAFDRSVITFALADGRGCARLFESDRERSALLLERLGRNVADLALPVERQLEIICEVLARVWVRVPSDTKLPTGAEKARWLAEFIATAWESLGRPCSEHAVALALEYAAEREAAFDPGSAVLVHGDAHSWNTCEAGSGTFKLVDPEGLVSEPAHDLAVPMRELNDELLAGDALALGRARARLLSGLTGVDETAIWQWGFVERVSTGLYSMQFGHVGAADFLTVADRWVGR